MAISTAETSKPKKGPKVLSHIEVHSKLGGGHIVRHVYHGYQHEPREYNFDKDEGNRAAAHIARYAGLPASKGAEEPGEAQEAE